MVTKPLLTINYLLDNKIFRKIHCIIQLNTNFVKKHCLFKLNMYYITLKYIS